MLLVIHNLPLNTRYSDVKTLIKDKCGLTEMIVDNLVVDGKSKKVTVGLADEEDAAILIKKINGLFVCNQQLYVEDVRHSKKSEQFYRPGSMSNEYQKEQYNQPQAQFGNEFHGQQDAMHFQPSPQMSMETQLPGPSAPNFGVPFYMTSQNQNVENNLKFMVQYPKVQSSMGNEPYEGQDIGFDQRYGASKGDQSTSSDRGSRRERSPTRLSKWNENDCDRSEGRRGHDKSGHRNDRRNRSPQRNDRHDRSAYRNDRRDRSAHRNDRHDRSYNDKNYGEQRKSNQDYGSDKQSNTRFDKFEPNWERPERSTRGEHKERYRVNDNRTVNVQDRRNDQEREQQRFRENDYSQSHDSGYASRSADFKKRSYDSSDKNKFDSPNKKFGSNEQYNSKMQQEASDSFFSMNYESKNKSYLNKSPEPTSMQQDRPYVDPKGPPVHLNRPQMLPNRPQMQPNRPQMVPNSPQMLPNRPQMQPNRPLMQPNRPQMQANRPQVQPNRTQMQPNRPQMQPNRPQMQPNRPQMQPNRPQMQPNRPQMQPNRPQMQPNRPQLQPNRPQMLPNRPLMQPNRPQIKPNRPQMQPNRPQMQPKDLQKNKPQWLLNNQSMKYIKKQMTFTKDRPTESKKPTAEILAKQEAWRLQTAAVVTAQILKNVGVNLNKRDPVLMKLKACVRARIDVSMGGDAAFTLKDMIHNYRQNFRDDDAFYKAVLEIVENSEQDEFGTKNKGTEEVFDESNNWIAREIVPSAIPALIIILSTLMETSGATESEQIDDKKKTEVKPNLQFIGKPPAIVPPNTGDSQKLPKYPAGDKKVLRQMKQAQKDEITNDSLYTLDAEHEKALADELDKIDELIKQEVEISENVAEATVSKFMKDVFVPDFRKILSLHIKKRILDVRTNLSIRVICQYKSPKRASLDAFLKDYGVLSLKASDKNRNVLVAICDSYESFDALCRQGSTVIDNLLVSFKPLHITGPPIKTKFKKQAVNSNKPTTQINNKEEKVNDGNEELSESKENDCKIGADIQENQGTEINLQSNKSEDVIIIEDNVNKSTDVIIIDENDDKTTVDDNKVPEIAPETDADPNIASNNDKESDENDDKTTVDDNKVPAIAPETDADPNIAINNDKESVSEEPNKESVPIDNDEGEVTNVNDEATVTHDDEIVEHENVEMIDNDNIADDDLEDF